MISRFRAIPAITRDHGDLLSFPKRFFQVLALRRKQFCAVLRHVPVVFQSYAKFSANINPRFVAECHIWDQRQCVSTDEIWPLMPVHTDSMPNTMCEVFVVWPVACIGDYFPRSGIDGLAFHTRLGRCQRG